VEKILEILGTDGKILEYLFVLFVTADEPLRVRLPPWEGGVMETIETKGLSPTRGGFSLGCGR